MIKLVIIAIGLTLAVCNPATVENNKPTATVEDNKPTGDCRPSAEVVRTSLGVIEVTFNRNLVEIVDGHVHCDFGYVATKVYKPLISRKPLGLIDREDKPVYTIHDASIDLEDPLSCEMDGTSYLSDSSSIEKRENRLTVRLRKFPPK